MFGAAFLRHVTYLPVFGACYRLGAAAQLLTAVSIGHLLSPSFLLPQFNILDLLAPSVSIHFSTMSLIPTLHADNDLQLLGQVRWTTSRLFGLPGFRPDMLI